MSRDHVLARQEVDMSNAVIKRSHIGTGYRWEATLFLEVWEGIEKRYGRDVAREVCGAAMYQAGVRFGKAMAQQKGRNDLAALKEAWEDLYPVDPTSIEWTGDRFVVNGGGCAIKGTLELYSIPPDLFEEIAQVFCEGDRGFVNGFNPDIVFTWGGRILRHDKQCQWIMEAE
jgi:hypothetical protein